MKKRLAIGFALIVMAISAFLALTPMGRFLTGAIIIDATRPQIVKRIDREARSQSVEWGRQVDHSAHIFSDNHDRAYIEAMLAKIDFEAVSEIASYNTKTMKGEFDLASNLYKATIPGIPCAKTYYLFLTFDDSDMLISAKSAQFPAGCL